MVKSTNPGKQRLSIYTADQRARRARMGVHLSKELRTKMGRRNAVVRVGDTVKIIRGDNAGKAGNVTQLDYARNKVFIQGLIHPKADGKEAFFPFRPSNLIITTLVEKDKKRFKKKNTNKGKEKSLPVEKETKQVEKKE